MKERMCLGKSGHRAGKDYTRRLEFQEMLLHSATKDMFRFVPSKPALIGLIGDFDMRVVNSFATNTAKESDNSEAEGTVISGGGLPKSITRQQVLSMRQNRAERSNSICHKRIYVSAEQEEGDIDLHKRVHKSSEQLKLPILPPCRLNNLKLNRKRYLNGGCLAKNI